MQFNLKNRPKLPKDDVPTVDDFNDIEKWFEGFEKELREVFKSIFDVWDKLPDEQLKKFVHQRLKEILGVSPERGKA